MRITKKQIGKLVESFVKEHLGEKSPKGESKIWQVREERYGSRESNIVFYAFCSTEAEAVMQAKKTLSQAGVNASNLYAHRIDEDFFYLMAQITKTDLNRAIVLQRSLRNVEEQIKS